MKLTTRSEYALLALIYLARKAPESDAFTPVDVIATAQNIPPKFLEQILLTLKRGHFLTSQKGQRGGYRLAKSPTEITLAEIVRLLDGPLAPTESVSKYFYRATPVEKEENLLKVLAHIRDVILDIMEKTTLAEIS
ncbi:MAG TPA: Rrf2 family transcriptional regulator [Aggregatilineales bacterium]|nr:Rrf2 family transcriptional regulator [Anaerolineales bacterium]HRE48975.1 Rrf2 family transcriptional regulator [Aggregatilineales bacterium]